MDPCLRRDDREKMMSSIAGYGLFIVSGKINRIGEMLEDISRRGVDGHAFTALGLKARRSEITTERDFDSDLAANAALVIYKVLQGMAVTVVDENFITYDNVIVLGVDAVWTKKTGAMVGGWGSVATNRTILRVQWVLQVTE